MQTLHVAVQDTLTRIQRFLDENAASLSAVNSSDARRLLDETARRMAGHSVDQGSRTIAAVGETKKAIQLSKALRANLMAPISEMAKARRIALPETDKVRMPRANKSGTALVSAALAMADAVTPFAAEFIAGGLRPDFIDRLRAGATALRDALAVRIDHRRRRSGARIGIDAESSRARSVIRMLHASITQHLADQPELLAEWQVIKRIPKKPGGGGERSAPVSVPLTVSGPATEAPASAAA